MLTASGFQIQGKNPTAEHFPQSAASVLPVIASNQVATPPAATACQFFLPVALAQAGI